MFLLIRALAFMFPQMVVISLHSTMFLLIRFNRANNPIHFTDFTFHNVSINTMETARLHSRRKDFTFHNVSINTEAGLKLKDGKILFTFHNVSINTVNDLWDVSPAYDLYIPQCFY